VPSSEGDYREIRQVNATTGSFSFDWDDTSGHFINPMFQLYTPPISGEHMDIRTYLQCSIDGKDVFDMTFYLLLGRG